MEKEIYAKELEYIVSVAVDKMPPQRKLIYTLSRVQGLNNDEIAEHLSISKRTVENHLTQALADIRKIIRVIVLIFFT